MSKFSITILLSYRFLSCGNESVFLGAPPPLLLHKSLCMLGVGGGGEGGGREVRYDIFSTYITEQVRRIKFQDLYYIGR